MRIASAIIVLILAGCNHTVKVAEVAEVTEVSKATTVQETFVPVYTTGPPALVYKTKANYDSLVPVILSEDKTKIVSYPSPSDVVKGNTFAYPVLLHNNYLLDMKGISPTIAFLKIKYSDYAKLKESPSVDYLYRMILDKDPLTELCNCGNLSAINNPEKQLNSLIDSSKLKTICKILK